MHGFVWKGQTMIGRIGIVLLTLVFIVGCEKKEADATGSGQGSTPAAKVQEPTPDQSAADSTQSAAATVPTKLGDAAYPLVGLTWVKGEPVNVGGGKVTVVEFWATWCPPCRVSIPHLTDLQAKYEDRGVVVVGISNEDEATVRPFVEKMGQKMDYHVAIDGAGKVGGGYMGAFKQNSIPTAFVVDKAGKVLWHGHPAEIEPVLDQVVSGTYAAR